MGFVLERKWHIAGRADIARKIVMIVMIVIRNPVKRPVRRPVDGNIYEWRMQRMLNVCYASVS